MSETTPSLSDRILDAFPSGSYGLIGLLRIVAIEESAEIETAAVECSTSPRLLVNRSFVDTYANSPEKLLMLVMHELHHVLLGHTTLFPHSTPIQNLVFDAVINALLCRMFPDRAGIALFSDFYSDRRFPECVLRPPARWRPNRRPEIPPALKHPAYKELAAVYQTLYSESSADYYELFQALTKLVRFRKGVGLPALLGDHSGRAFKPAPGDALFDAVREIVEHWPNPPKPIAGRSWADLLSLAHIRPSSWKANRAILRRLINQVADSGTARTSLRMGVRELEVLYPWQGLDRRSVVLRALGQTPLMHRSAMTSRQARGYIDPVHVYVDVSGSIGDLKGCLYAAVIDSGEVVHPRVHLFSTRVRTITLPELRRGVCWSTGGTSIHCVAKHMKANDIRRAVLVTDGYVGTPHGEDRKTLETTKLGVALCPGNSIRGDLVRVANYWALLEDSRK